MAQRWALPSDVNRETATNDAIAYSCKKIGHLYSAYFLHIRTQKTDFSLFYVSQILILVQNKKWVQGYRPPKLHLAYSQVRCWLSPKRREKIDPTPSVTGTQSDASDGCFRCPYYAFLATLSALLIKVCKLFQSFISLVSVDSCTKGNIKVMDYVMIIKCPRLSVFAQS